MHHLQERALGHNTDQTCLVCGATSREVIPAVKKGYLRCRKCGLVAQEKKSSPSEITDHYEIRDPIDRVSLSRVHVYDQFLRGVSTRIKDPGRLLDVGCSRGDFIERAIEYGWGGYGVEPVERLAAEATVKGLQVFSGVLAQMPRDWGPFDLITYWDAFMLVDDPIREMERAVSCLSEKGWIYLRLRQHGVQQLLRRFWQIAGRRIGLPDYSVYHPLNFTPRTIRALAGLFGMETRITNSPLTRGDPYSMHRLNIPITAGKAFISTCASIANRISRGRWIISPGMDIWMRPQ
ncbi:class I SAM-dependent methyltransferase [Gemmatimonadota bacterium]